LNKSAGCSFSDRPNNVLLKTGSLFRVSKRNKKYIMAPSASATAPGKAQQKQTWLSTWLAALLSVRYVQQSLILTWKNCE
jgi:hypothetical protein